LLAGRQVAAIVCVLYTAGAPVGVPAGVPAGSPVRCAIIRRHRSHYPARDTASRHRDVVPQMPVIAMTAWRMTTSCMGRLRYLPVALCGLCLSGQDGSMPHLRPFGGILCFWAACSKLSCADL